MLLTGATPTSELEVTFNQLRSSKGMIRLCVTANPKSFPGCAKDAHAITRSVPAGEHVIRVQGLVPGTYALSVIHDENGNGKLDSNMIGMPVEAYGFSNNPNVMRKPTWDEARFEVGVQDAAIAITLR